MNCLQEGLRDGQHQAINIKPNFQPLSNQPFDLLFSLSVALEGVSPEINVTKVGGWIRI